MWLVVIAAVIATLAAGVAMIFMATIDAWVMLTHLADYASLSLDSAARTALRSSAITHVVEIADGYLLAMVLLIFALGLYELFISKIDRAEGARNLVQGTCDLQPR